MSEDSILTLDEAKQYLVSEGSWDTSIEQQLETIVETKGILTIKVIRELCPVLVNATAVKLIKDDIFTEEQLEQLRTKFQTFDEDQDGLLNFNELENALWRSTGDRPSHDELISLMKLIDLDHDKSVSFEEFVNMLHMFMLEENSDMQEQEESEKQLKPEQQGSEEMVASTDDNGDLTEAEISRSKSTSSKSRKYRRRHKNKKNTPCMEQEAREAFREFDRNGNGYISYHELRTVMLQVRLSIEEAELQEMLRKADIDEDGVISYTEFLSSWYLT